MIAKILLGVASYPPSFYLFVVVLIYHLSSYPGFHLVRSRIFNFSQKFLSLLSMNGIITDPPSDFCLITSILKYIWIACDTLIFSCVTYFGERFTPYDLLTSEEFNSSTDLKIIAIYIFALSILSLATLIIFNSAHNIKALKVDLFKDEKTMLGCSFILHFLGWLFLSVFQNTSSLESNETLLLFLRGVTLFLEYYFVLYLFATACWEIISLIHNDEEIQSQNLPRVIAGLFFCMGAGLIFGKLNMHGFLHYSLFFTIPIVCNKDRLKKWTKAFVELMDF